MFLAFPGIAFARSAHRVRARYPTRGRPSFQVMSRLPYCSGMVLCERARVGPRIISVGALRDLVAKTPSARMRCSGVVPEISDLGDPARRDIARFTQRQCIAQQGATVAAFTFALCSGHGSPRIATYQ